MTPKRWQHLMKQFGFEANEQAYAMLLQKYQEKHRAYHNVAHINDCLSQLDQLPALHPEAREIELAIWFHDVIYDPYGKDNERKSAQKAELFIFDNVADDEPGKRISDLIMATLHQAPPTNSAEALIMDIDISILGRDETSYQRYTEQVRQEYRFVPRFLYRTKRVEILQKFLQRESLYSTPYFQEQYEEQARKNIAQEIEQLAT